MDSQRRRKHANGSDGLEQGSPQKRLKASNSKNSSKAKEESIVVVVADEDTSTTTTPLAPNDGERPKSRKELRKEKQASKRAAKSSSRADTTADDTANKTSNPPTAADILRLKKERRAETRKEIKTASQNAAQEREEAHDEVRKAKKAARAQQKEERATDAEKTTRRREKAPSKTEKNLLKKDKKPRPDVEFNAGVFNSVFYATSEDDTGTTTCRLGVKYRDVKIGKGPEVQDRSLVKVKYKLKGGKFGALLDSNNNFTFRLGKGEVIQGWDIGMMGMRQGGTRHLIVPPKAGYKSEDIGAGPGGILHFDITLLSC